MIAQVSPVILAFGANLGDRISTIRDAQSALAHHPAITEFTPSPLRETVAVTLEGPDETAPKYLNGVPQLSQRSHPSTCLISYKNSNNNLDALVKCVGAHEHSILTSSHLLEKSSVMSG